MYSTSLSNGLAAKRNKEKTDFDCRTNKRLCGSFVFVENFSPPLEKIKIYILCGLLLR
jgi:hypothetical protein